MAKKESCLKPLKAQVNNLTIEEIIGELNKLFSESTYEACKAEDKELLGFAAPRHLSKRFNDLSAYTRLPAEGVWHNKEGKLFVDDNYLYFIEFKDDANNEISERAKELISELILRKIDIPKEEFPYIFRAKLEDSTL